MFALKAMTPRMPNQGLTEEDKMSCEIELINVLDDVIKEKCYSLAQEILKKVENTFSLYEGYCALVDYAEAQK